MGTDIRVLVVEDSATQAEQLHHLLEGFGYLVDLVKNGAQALAYLESRLPAVILSDVIMPVMDGFELCTRVKGDDRLRHIPIILLTALADTEDIIRSLDAAADNYLTKPFAAEVLEERIRQVLANAERCRRSVPDVELEIVFAGHRHVINPTRVQILDLLLSSYQNAFERQRELEETHRALEEANRKVRALQGLIPICAKCKKIRNDQGYWKQVESYLSEHTGSTFSHGLCPGCLEDSYEELRRYLARTKDA